MTANTPADTAITLSVYASDLTAAALRIAKTVLWSETVAAGGYHESDSDKIRAVFERVMTALETDESRAFEESLRFVMAPDGHTLLPDTASTDPGDAGDAPGWLSRASDIEPDWLRATAWIEACVGYKAPEFSGANVGPFTAASVTKIAVIGAGPGGSPKTTVWAFVFNINEYVNAGARRVDGSGAPRPGTYGYCIATPEADSAFLTRLTSASAADLADPKQFAVVSVYSAAFTALAAAVREQISLPLVEAFMRAQDLGSADSVFTSATVGITSPRWASAALIHVPQSTWRAHRAAWPAGSDGRMSFSAPGASVASTGIAAAPEGVTAVSATLTGGSRSLSTGEIVGITLGSVVGFTALIGGAVLLAVVAGRTAGGDKRRGKTWGETAPVRM